MTRRELRYTIVLVPDGMISGQIAQNRLFPSEESLKIQISKELVRKGHTMRLILEKNCSFVGFRVRVVVSVVGQGVMIDKRASFFCKD